MGDESLSELSTAKFTHLVNDALKNYQNLIRLSHSPLAASSLVSPALVINDLTPTIDDCGRALRIVLRWAAKQLAPATPDYPFGELCPFDEPTWRDPLWRHYHIIRHCYLETLCKDDLDFLGHRGAINALIHLMDISNRKQLYKERKQAVQKISALLARQLTHRQHDDELRYMAAEELYQSLENYTIAQDLLDLASTFRYIFPRSLLLEMARQAGLHKVEIALGHLVTHRLLLKGDKQANLLMPPALQKHVHSKQSNVYLMHRHSKAAQFYLNTDQAIQAAWHLQTSKRFTQAANALLQAAETLVDDLQIKELQIALSAFKPEQLSPSQWRQVQTLQSELLQRTGKRAQALLACHQALNVTANTTHKAQLYHRLGKLYENHNAIQALHYYQLAKNLFDPDDPGQLYLLKDRAWLYIHRSAWSKAESDLKSALERTESTEQHLRADIYDALASIYRRQRQCEKAISFAQKALGLREKMRDMPRVADSFNNLGLIYADMGEPEYAIAACNEALATYQRLDNQEAIATVKLNIGAALYLTGDLAQAIISYLKCLAICQEIGLPRVKAKAYYNLAAAYAELGQTAQAQSYWLAGFTLCQKAGLEDQIQYFGELQSQMPALHAIGTPSSHPLQSPQSELALLPEESIALDIVRDVGWVSTKSLMEKAGVSKSTAKRRLAKLTQQGLLIQIGKGRATYYKWPEN